MRKRDVGIDGVWEYCPVKHMFVESTNKDIGLVIGFKLGNHLFDDLIVEKSVATVKEVEVFARSPGNALVHGIVDTFVGFGHPVDRELFGEVLNYFDTTIFATAINYYIFKVLKSLRDDTLNGLLQPIGIIPVNGNDR